MFNYKNKYQNKLHLYKPVICLATRTTVSYCHGTKSQHFLSNQKRKQKKKKLFGFLTFHFIAVLVVIYITLYGDVLLLNHL